MEILRNLARRLTPSLKNLSTQDKLKYRAALRIAYFFSSTSLFGCALYLLFNNEKNKDVEDEEFLLLMGKPVLKDLSAAHREMREQGTARGLIAIVKDGQNMFIDYNREEYLKDMEEAAYRRAREAQANALAQGKELPKDALRLV